MPLMMIFSSAMRNVGHWVLDMAFDKENNRTRQDYSASKQAGVMINYLNYWRYLTPDFTRKVRG
jgi:predicted transposase YbfD/YdcC